MVEMMDKFYWEKIVNQDQEKIPIEIRKYVVAYVDHRLQEFQNSLPIDIQEAIEKYGSQF
jgi:hypothetical protein